MKIGLIDLDTSHPHAWVPILRALGHEVLGVYDHGDVHPPGYAETFAREHDIATVFPGVEAMVDAVDAAVIHSCDWDTHLARAEPFINRGGAVLIDKPLAGNMRDLDQLVRWEQGGARIAGGSALRFCDEVRAFQTRCVEERGTPETVFVACGVDEFNYGIHAYALLLGLMGPGPLSVQHLGQGHQRRVRIDWLGGRTGFVVVGAAAQWLPYAATVVTERHIEQITIDITKLYRGLLQSVLPHLAGEAAAPLTMTQLVESERCAVAARRSWMQGDRAVGLNEAFDDDSGYDGRAFVQGYRLQKYPAAAGING